MDKGLCADMAAEGAFSAAVEAAVQFKMDVLGEFGAAQLALVGFLSRVKALVSLEVAGAAEAFVTHLERKAKVQGYFKNFSPEHDS